MSNNDPSTLTINTLLKNWNTPIYSYYQEEVFKNFLRDVLCSENPEIECLYRIIKELYIIILDTSKIKTYLDLFTNIFDENNNIKNILNYCINIKRLLYMLYAKDDNNCILLKDINYNKYKTLIFKIIKFNFSDLRSIFIGKRKKESSTKLTQKIDKDLDEKFKMILDPSFILSKDIEEQENNSSNNDSNSNGDVNMSGDDKIFNGGDNEIEDKIRIEILNIINILIVNIDNYSILIKELQSFIVLLINFIQSSYKILKENRNFYHEIQKTISFYIQKYIKESNNNNKLNDNNNKLNDDNNKLNDNINKLNDNNNNKEIKSDNSYQTIIDHKENRTSIQEIFIHLISYLVNKLLINNNISNENQIILEYLKKINKLLIEDSIKNNTKVSIKFPEYQNVIIYEIKSYIFHSIDNSKIINIVNIPNSHIYFNLNNSNIDVFTHPFLFDILTFLDENESQLFAQFYINFLDIETKNKNCFIYKNTLTCIKHFFDINWIPDKYYELLNIIKKIGNEEDKYFKIKNIIEFIRDYLSFKFQNNHVNSSNKNEVERLKNITEKIIKKQFSSIILDNVDLIVN